MFIREIMLLYIFSLLHFRASECELVIKPQNVAVVSGTNIILHCASDVSAGNIIWSITDPGSTAIYTIYNQYVLASSVSSYISVSDREDGNCSLNISASLTAGKRYICTEADSGQEASAELIVLKSGPQCNSRKGSVQISCFTVSSGNWPPVVECYQWKHGVGLIVLRRSDTLGVDKNVVTRTWNYTGQNELFLIFCEAAFMESDRPKESSATNIPTFFKQTLAYSGTMSNNNSAKCPAVITACPVAATAKCPECPIGATSSLVTSANCPECPSETTASHAIAAKCPECLSGTTKCPECPAGVSACPVAATAKCPECPTEATASHVTSAKCPECPTEATESHVASAKCPECPAEITASHATAAKCPECPAETIASHVTAAKCPECPAETSASHVTAAKCPRCLAETIACPVAAAAKCKECPDCPAEATAWHVTTAAKRSESSAAPTASSAAADFHRPHARDGENSTVKGPNAQTVALAGSPATAAAVEGPATTAAAVGPVGPGLIVSVVLNCVSVFVWIGIAIAVCNGHITYTKTTEDKKPKSTEQDTALKDSDQDSQEEAGGIHV